MFRATEVAKNNGADGSPVWVTYGGIVYDITNFIANHPGGSEKIMEAAGQSVEPHWFMYRQHFASDLPMKFLEPMAIGRLDDADQEKVDSHMEKLEEADPYAREPKRHPALLVHSETPMNAEVPEHLLTRSFLTPNHLFYIRHHHPVPFLMPSEINDYKVTIDLTSYNGTKIDVSLHDIKKLPKIERVVTLQCSGNRRGNFNAKERTSGTPWGQGAMSTAKFGGAKLKDVLKLAGLNEDIEDQHVRFHSKDGMMASIGTEKALNPYGDCIVAYEMNGEALPRDHGFPLRMIVPGYAAVRNVKWLDKIELSQEEAEGSWQRGLNYKILPPSVKDASTVELNKMPSVSEVSLFSGITKLQFLHKIDESVVRVKVGGWAWAGGGRNIVRVEVTADNAKSWDMATLTEGADQKHGRAWAWVFWECELDAQLYPDGTIRVASKAVDMCFNSQPESLDNIWNLRGLGNNSWYSTSFHINCLEPHATASH